jgi:hypothetical protein
MTGWSESLVHEWLGELQSGLKSLVIEGADTQLSGLSPLIQRLWANHPLREVEVFGASDYDHLMARIDQLISNMTIAVAGQAAPAHSPMILWVLNHSEQFTPEQLLLLGQIMIHLPGLNLRMLLLHAGSGIPKSWTDATRGQTRVHRLPALEHSEPLALPDAVTADLQHEDMLSHRHDPLAGIASEASHKSWIKSPGLHALTAIVFLAAGWGLGRWTAPQQVETEVIIESNQASLATASPSSEPAPEQSAKEQTTPEASTASMQEPAMQLVAKPINPEPAKPEPANSPAEKKRADSPLQKAQPEAAPATPPVHAVQGQRKAIEQTLQVSPDDVSWLRGISADDWVVAHGSFRLLDHARRLQSSHPELARSKIVPILLAGEPAYAVLTGPFKSQDRAQTYLQKLSWSADCKALPAVRTQRLVEVALSSAR